MWCHYPCTKENNQTQHNKQKTKNKTKGVWNAALMNGFNLSNTIVVFVSDHGEMNMEHRQTWKNSFYEGSSRIPLFFAGPGIKQNVLIKHFTGIIDVLPTLIELGTQDRDKIPPFLDGQSLVRFLNNDDYADDDEKRGHYEKPFKNYQFSQYHSNLANTGSFMIRQHDYKYIQFGHYLDAYQNYSAQLFNTENDFWELNDLAKERNFNSTIDEIMINMENILKEEIDYEYVDCKAKQNDFKVFEEYFWQKYNSTQLKSKFKNEYIGFDDNDWTVVQNWRNEMISLGAGFIEACDSLTK